MQDFFNHNIIDVAKARWGNPPVPLLPASLLELWGEEPLPDWLISESHLPGGATVSALGRQYWATALSVTPRVEHFISFLIKSRAQSIKSIPCFSCAWPSGLRIANIPFSVRSLNRLDAMGFVTNPELLMKVTFGQLLRVPALGSKSLIEITTLTEFAVEFHWSVASEFARGIGEVTNHATVPLTQPQAARVRHLNEVIRLAKSIGEIPDETGAIPSRVNAGWARDLTEIVSEPWADQVSEE